MVVGACNDDSSSTAAGSTSMTTTDASTGAEATSTATVDSSASEAGTVASSDDSVTIAETSSTADSSTTDATTTGTTTGGEESTTSTEGPVCVLPDDDSSSGDELTPLDLGVDGGCGNAVIEIGEVCDDGNLVPGDGCESDCTSSDDVPPLWTLTMGGPNTIPDCGTGVAFDSQNNLIIAGYVLDAVWIRKYDTSYEELWTVTYPGLPGALCTDTPIAVDSNDNIAFAGVTGEELNPNFIFGLLDPDGTEIWSEVYDGPVSRADFVHGIAVDDEDNLIVVGTQENPMDDVEGAVLKYSNDGQWLWSDFFDGGDTSQGGAWDVDTDPCGAIVVSGFSFSIASASDIVVRKYDADGGLVWERTEITDLTEWAYAVGVDGQGRVVAAGSQLQPPSNYFDFWMRQYDAAGDELWTLLLDGGAGGSDGVYGLVVDAASGAFWAAGVTGPQQTSTDAWLRRHDATGATVWTRTIYFGGSSNGWLAIARAPDGRIGAAGSSSLPFPNDREAQFAVYPP